MASYATCPQCGGVKDPKSRRCASCRKAADRERSIARFTCPRCGGYRSKREGHCAACHNETTGILPWGVIEDEMTFAEENHVPLVDVAAGLVRSYRARPTSVERNCERHGQREWAKVFRRLNRRDHAGIREAA